MCEKARNWIDSFAPIISNTKIFDSLDEYLAETKRVLKINFILYGIYSKIAFCSFSAISIFIFFLINNDIIFGLFSLLPLSIYILISIYFIKLVKKNKFLGDKGKYKSLIYIAIDYLFVTVLVLFFIPYGWESVVFGFTHLLFLSVIIFSITSGNWRNIIFSSVFGFILHSVLIYIAIDEVAILDRVSYEVLKEMFPLGGMLVKNLFYIPMGLFLAGLFFNLAKFNAMSGKVEAVKPFSKTYLDLIFRDGTLDSTHWSFFKFSNINDKTLGADFVAIEEYKSNIYIIFGDIISHGLNPSQGAIAILGAFFGSVHSENLNTIFFSCHNSIRNVRRENGGEALIIVLKLYPDGTIETIGGVEEMSMVDTDLKISFIETDNLIIGKEINDLDVQNAKIRNFKATERANIVLKTDGIVNGDVLDDQTVLIITFSGEKKVATEI